jgi:hypothetical protein
MKHNLVPIVFAIAGVLNLVPVVVSVIKGEPLNYTFLAIACSSITLAVVLFAIGRKSSPPST